MQKTILLVLFILIKLTNLSAQTTQEEYNYITRGYSLQMLEGLDMKAGYKLEQGMVDTIYNRKIELKYLMRTNGTCAAIMLIHTNLYPPNGKVSGKYYCIPSSISDLEVQQQALKLYEGAFIQTLTDTGKEAESAEFHFLYTCLSKSVGKIKIK